MDESVVLALIERIYAASVDAELWNLFLEDFAEAFRGRQATLFSHDLHDRRASFHANARIDDAFMASYVSYYFRTNMFVDKAIGVREGIFITTDDLVDRRAYEISEFYNDWVRPQGCLEFATTNIFRDSTLLTGVTVLRGSQPFTPAEVRCWTSLMPHLQRAVQIHRHLVSARLGRDGAVTALERLAVGVVLAGPNGEILFCNSVADQILKGASGLLVRNGRLCGETPAATELLLHTIRAACLTGIGRDRHAGGVVPLPRRLGGTAPVLVSPIDGAGAIGEVIAGEAAMVLLTDPRGKRTVRADDLVGTFGVTPAEGRLMVALVEGRSLTEHAACTGISVLTARSHLKRIFEKTGTHSQSDLVRMALANPIIARSSGEG